MWMPKIRQMEVTLKDLKPNSYFLVNVDRIGFYRVLYDEANWMLIANELLRMESSSSTNISPNSRAMLINDAAIFFNNNMLRVRVFLELLRHLKNNVRMFAFYYSMEHS
jgi:aminopeptidase N